MMGAALLVAQTAEQSAGKLTDMRVEFGAERFGGDRWCHDQIPQLRSLPLGNPFRTNSGMQPTCQAKGRANPPFRLAWRAEFADLAGRLLPSGGHPSAMTFP